MPRKQKLANKMHQTTYETCILLYTAFLLKKIPMYLTISLFFISLFASQAADRHKQKHTIEHINKT